MTFIFSKCFQKTNESIFTDMLLHGIPLQNIFVTQDDVFNTLIVYISEHIKLCNSTSLK